MFAEIHKLILGDQIPSFGDNFFSENLKLRIFDFVYVIIHHFVCYEVEIN